MATNLGVLWQCVASAATLRIREASNIRQRQTQKRKLLYKLVRGVGTKVVRGVSQSTCWFACMFARVPRNMYNKYRNANISRSIASQDVVSPMVWPRVATKVPPSLVVHSPGFVFSAEYRAVVQSEWRPHLGQGKLQENRGRTQLARHAALFYTHSWIQLRQR